MARRRSIEDRLAELETAIDAADPDSAAAVLADGIASGHYRIAAFAARRAAQALAYACVPALLEAYARFLVDPVKRDPNCLAKAALMRALHELDCDDADFYLAALSYRQREPVWGGSVDTAVDVRASAAMALVASGYPRALAEVAGLMTDPEVPVRIGAVRAVACGNPREAELLLRLKIATGDEEPQVLGECFTALLGAEPDESVPFVAQYLEAEDEAIRELAALALGESRLPAAFAALKRASEAVLVPAAFRRSLIQAAALLRSDESQAWLLELAATRDIATAAEVVDALAPFRRNERLAERLEAVLAARGDAVLAERFESVWRSA